MAVIPFLFACSSKTELAIPKTNLKPCSSLSKEGIEEIWEEINKYI